MYIESRTFHLTSLNTYLEVTDSKTTDDWILFDRFFSVTFFSFLNNFKIVLKRKAHLWMGNIFVLRKNLPMRMTAYSGWSKIAIGHLGFKLMILKMPLLSSRD